MSATPFARIGATRIGAVQYFFWSHPDWWSIAICVCAWAWMLPHGWQTSGHGSFHRLSFAQELLSWMGMVAAMMVPLTLDAVRLAAARSLWERRHRAIAWFLTGYLAPWLGLGVAVTVLRQGSWTHTNAAAAIGFVAAALWQQTPMHRQAEIACHATYPLAPEGWRADRDCLAFGGRIGSACVRSCWPLMLACAFTGHAWLAMIGGMAVGVAERWPYRPRTRLMLATTLCIAAYYSALALIPSAGWGMIQASDVICGAI